MPRYVRSQLWWSDKRQTYELSIDGVLHDSTVEPDLAALESVPAFSFRSSSGARYTLRKQTVQRGGSYWYGYRRLHGHLVKRYVSKAANLSLARLEEVGRLFASDNQPPPLPAHQTGSERPYPADDWLLFSKLSPPRLPGLLVERAALLARLDHGLSYPLSLLQAPAGSGKSMLLAQWISERRVQKGFPAVAWLTLDVGDNDPLRFWRALIRACQGFGAPVGQVALSQLAAALEPPFQLQPLEAAVSSLLLDLAQQQLDGVLILDDYHAITEPQVHESLNFFLDHLPTGLRVMLLSRSEPPRPLLRWRARGILYELHRADLRFSLEETATFLRQASVPHLPDATLSQLDARLGGWAAGLRLLAHTLQGKRSTPEVVQALRPFLETSDLTSVDAGTAGPQQQLLAYFVTEILEAQPAALQRFLLLSSVCNHLTTSLCAAISDEASGADQLATVARAGLFLEEVDAVALALPQTSQIWYRYHALWSSALRQEARKRLGEEELRACLSRASHWYEQHAMLAEAIEMALKIGDFERTAWLVEQADEQGEITEPHTLYRWLSPMPESVLRSHPMLCWLYALALSLLEETGSSRERVQALLQRAEAGWREYEQPAFLGLIDAFYALSAWKNRDFEAALARVRQALVLLVADDPHRRIRVFRGVCLFIIGSSQMYVGRFDEARNSLLEASACGLGRDGRPFTRSMFLLLGICSDALGELHQAHEYYQQARSTGPHPDNHEISAQAKLGLARISLEWHDLDSGERLAHEALEMAEDEVLDVKLPAEFQLARLCFARGQIAAAEQRLAALEVRLQITPTPQASSLLCEVRLWQARCLLHSGDFEYAQRLLATQDMREYVPAALGQARLKLARQQPDCARQQLEGLLPLSLPRRDTLELHILLTLACADCQMHQQAREHLLHSLSLALSGGFLLPFILEGETLARLLRQLAPTLREPALHSYALTLLRLFQSPAGTATSSDEHLLVEPLSPQERRVLRLLMAGHSNQEIAGELVVSINTVKDHVKRIYRKLGVNTRVQASLVARHLQLL